MNTSIAMTLDPGVLVSFLIGTVLPLLVGLVTKVQTHPGIKAILLAILTIITSVLTQLVPVLQNGGQFPFWTAMIGAIGTYAVSQSTHAGIWKNTGITAALQAVGSNPAPPKP
jgi:hypothetical protein